MNKKTGAIIATVVTVLLCGCPGLVLLLFGAAAATGKIPILPEFPYTSDFGNPSDTFIPSYVGFALLCVALIFIAIPVVVGVLTLRKKPAKPASVNEPPTPSA